MKYVKLKNVFDLKRGGVYDNKDLLSFGKYPVLKAGVEPSGYLNEAKIIAPANRIRVIFCGMSSGVIGYVTQEFINGSNNLYLEQKQKILDDKFIYYFLKTKEELFFRTKNIAGVHHLNFEVFENILIPLPPLNQQQKIAHLLTSLENAIKQLLPLLEQEKELRKQQFECYLNNVFNGLAKGQVTKLNGLITVNRGKQLNKEDVLKKGTYPVMNGAFQPTGYWNEFNTIANTIIVSQGGSMAGYVSLMKTKFWASAHCYCLTINKPNELSTEYLYLFLKYQQATLMGSAYGGGIPALSSASITSLAIPVMPMERQKIIASQLQKFEAIKDKITVQIPAEIELRKQQYKHYLNQIFLHLQ